MEANKEPSGSGGGPATPAPLPRRSPGPQPLPVTVVVPSNLTTLVVAEAHDLGIIAHYHSDTSSSKAPPTLAALKTARAVPLAEAVEGGSATSQT